MKIKLLLGLMLIFSVMIVFVYRDQGKSLPVNTEIDQSKVSHQQSKNPGQQKVTLSISVEPSFAP